ncbi:MAG: signal recognition particle receptor subunit alpha, partial [Candidatus Kuenenia sp.]|nr:signal recognition particle receptor subunit alpha [Candidatus Kuenenia sp.]
MFESITNSLEAVLGKFRGKGRLTEGNIKDGLHEVRLALLEADVNYKVVKNFIKQVTERSVGEEVIKSVAPGQQVVKIVHDELIKLMGESDTSIPFREG